MHLVSEITVAILNWNGLKHLQEFLPFVVQHSENAEVLLIDNGSTDQSVHWVQSHFPTVQVLVHPRNVGFTEGYNQGLKSVTTPFAVLLNSDVEVTEEWLKPLLSRINSDDAIAAVQPKILSYREKDTFEYAGGAGGFIDALGYPFCRGRIFDTCEKDLEQYDDAKSIFWASGACMLVRMSAYHEMNGLEPRFFAHMEEIDLCWRWQNQGYQIWVEPGSTVYHLGAGTLAKSNPRKTFLNFRNGLALLYMNNLDTSIFWKIPVRLCLDGLAGIQFVVKGEWPNMLAILKAHFSFYAMLGYWSSRRRHNQRTAKQGLMLSGYFKGSLVWSYFIRGKRRFADL